MPLLLVNHANHYRDLRSQYIFALQDMSPGDPCGMIVDWFFMFGATMPLQRAIHACSL
jgi:hypothetical protein